LKTLAALFSCLLITSVVGTEASALKILKVSDTRPERVYFSKELKILFPRSCENKRRNPVNVQMRVPNHSQGVQSQNFAIFVDNSDPFIITKNSGASKTGKTLVSFFLPKPLERGQHLIRVFAVDESGARLDRTARMRTCSFYFLDPKKASKVTYNDQGPVLTMLAPYSDKSYPSDSLILDVHFSDKTASIQRPNIALSIDSEFIGFVDAETAYKVEGLSSGKHQFTLMLYDGKTKCSGNPLSVCSRIVSID
jgi:hypothetical protein